MTKNNFRGNYNFPTNNNLLNEDTVLICDIIPEETEIKIALIAVSACSKNFERQDPKKKTSNEIYEQKYQIGFDISVC